MIKADNRNETYFEILYLQNYKRIFKIKLKKQQRFKFYVLNENKNKKLNDYNTLLINNINDEMRILKKYLKLS